MKKLLTLVLALGMTLSLAACGGVATKAMDAFNKVNTQYTEIGTMVNDNVELIDAETIDTLNQIATDMEGYRAEIGADEITQARADEIIKLLEPLPAQLTEIKSAVEDMIANGGATAGMIAEQARV